MAKEKSPRRRTSQVSVSPETPGQGLSPELIAKLADGGIHTRDDLADLAVDELTEMTGIDDAQAKTLIMQARAHWFTD